MAARRLLIVMLILLGLSTLAAALIPQRTLRSGTRSTTQAQTTTTTTNPVPAYLPPTKVVVGGKRIPVVSPVHVGDRLTLLVKSGSPAQISIPEFGQLGFTAPGAPARFDLLATTPGRFGILFANNGAVAGQIRVYPAGKSPPKAKSRARAGSGRS
jgi:hypothetical protein